MIDQFWDQVVLNPMVIPLGIVAPCDVIDSHTVLDSTAYPHAWVRFGEDHVGCQEIVILVRQPNGDTVLQISRRSFVDGRLDLSEPLLLGVILAPVFEVCGTFVPCGVFHLLPYPFVGVTKIVLPHKCLDKQVLGDRS
jgi:hypothetical protein